MSYKRITLILVLGIFLSSGRNANAQSQNFAYTGSLQTWTVPCATVITITANGAQGGTGVYGNGALGAQITGTFTVTPGQVLDIIVGQQGTGSFSGPYYCGSGGGATYIWNSANTTLPMIAAGAGGGYAYASTAGVGSATTTPNPSVGDGGSAAGGTGGNGGLGSYSGGGAGWLSNGGNGSSANGGADPANGAAGGTFNSPGANGGYGGGGGCSGNDGAGGGGGGYNGGGGGTVSNNWGAGGGGASYNGGTNQNNIAGTNSGNGSVTITWVPVVIAVTDTAKVVFNENACAGTNGSARAKATGISLTYKWAPGGATTDTATGLSAGTYTVTVNSPCGGSASSAVTITQPIGTVAVNANVLTNVSCSGGKNGSASATATGPGTPYTYSWTPSLQNTATATGLSAGVYTIKVMNACGASASATATITQPVALGVTATTTANISCNGGNNGSTFSRVTNGTSPYAYSWSPVGGNLDTAVGLIAGTYTIFLTDANGCTGSAKTTITQPNVLTISATTTGNVLCNGGNSGSASTTTAGGTSPYVYAWSNGQTAASATDLKVGTYTVSITDLNGCSATAQTTLTQPTAVNVIKYSTVDSGRCTGSAWVIVSGGVAPYSYLWNNNANSYYLADQCGTANYCCTITDAQGCKDSVCIPVYSVAAVANVSSTVEKVTVYPNPTSGQFTIATSMNGQWSVEVYNVLGERVYTQSSISTPTSNINISGQPNGIYLYRIISSQNGNLVGQGKMVLEK